MQAHALHFGKMKIKVIVIFIILLTAGFGFTARAQKQNSQTAEVTFTVNLHCQNCVKKVEANIPFEKGVTDMKISLDDRTVWLEYNPAKTDTEKLKKAIEKLGYKAEVKDKKN